MFTAAWDAASEESRRKTLRSTATVRSSAAAAAAPPTGNNCPVYACITPMRLLLQWEKVCCCHFLLGAFHILCKRLESLVSIWSGNSVLYSFYLPYRIPRSEV